MPSYIQLMQLVHSFEAYLGHPETQHTPVNFQQSLLYDEQELLAWPQIRFIQQWNFMDYLIPVAQGGALASLDSLYALVKSISRRDLTTAIGMGLSFLGALPIWLAGSVQQQQQLVALLRRGDVVAFAFTEKEHGSDIMANEVVATACEGGWQLSGQKWCINFATEGQAVNILCRTHDQGGPLGFSIFLLDKSQVGEGFTPSPKLPTLGVKGLDISGFGLDKVQLPQNALVGKEKQGLEISYKILQVSRTLCASFSVGAADSALRFALSFSLQRVLYGKMAYDIPVVKQRLGEQFTQLLVADCLGMVIARASSVLPHKLAFWSAVSKFLIPQMTEQIVDECSLILGARAYLRTTEWAMFQKIRRDIQVVGLFDGSSQVNLSLIAASLLTQTRMRGRCPPQELAQLEQIFNLQQSCPAFNLAELRLFMHDEDTILAGLGCLQSTAITPLIVAIRQQLALLDQQILSLHAQNELEPRSLAAFRLAENYCWIFAASCCLHFWHFNQELLVQEGLDQDWLLLAIQLMLNKLQANVPIDSRLQETMATKLNVFYQQNKLFSVHPASIPIK